MNLKFLALFITACITCEINYMNAVSLTKPYTVDNIPKSLLANANAVVRNDQMVQIIDNVNESRVKIKHAITLLNDRASVYRFYRIPYNDFIKISNIKAYVYDENGDLITSAKPDIRDVSGSYGALASSSRYWTITYPVRKYPFTLEIEYEKTTTGMFVFEEWGFQAAPDVAVEQSGIQLILKDGLGFRVHGENLKHSCDTFTLDDKTVYTWQENNLPAKKAEELFMVSFNENIPFITTAPKEFKMGGIQGSMESWESLGKYFYELNKDRDIISEELQRKIRSLTSSTTDKKEIVKKLYQYLQRSTRYVSIQLGIGGYQTLEASFVEKKGYGDCKALSNYMKALLKSIDINSYQALISNGDDDITTSFPCPQFNHVILCVPLNKDTIWLECTNQSIPFNFLGSSNSNKHVLLLTESGGKLVKTPDHHILNNKRDSKFYVNIDFLGNATLKGDINYMGISFEIPKQCQNSKKEEREEYINGIFAAPNIVINKLSFSEETADFPNIRLNCDFLLRNFVSKTARRMIFNPYLFNPAPYLSTFSEEDFAVKSTKYYTDSVSYTYPTGYVPEYVPLESKIETKFGKFDYKCLLDNGKILMIRRFEYTANVYEQKDEVEFIDFVNKIATLERQLIVLKKE